MKTFEVKLDELFEQTVSSIEDNVKEKGVESKHYNDLVIKVDNERSFNLGSDVWLEEVSENNLIDNNGQLYSFNCLSHEELAQLADWMETLKSNTKKPEKLDEVISIIEVNHSIDEYVENDKLCGYEMNTYTNGGVNQVVFLDFRDTGLDPKKLEDFLKVFEDRINSIDIDNEIEVNRYSESYKNNFSMQDSLEDFTDWKESLITLLNKVK